MDRPALEAPAGAHIFTVAELSREVKGLLETGLADVWVEGEVSNPKLYPSGHLYFDLKDADSLVACVIWRSRAQSLKFKLEQGLKVVARARVTSWQKSSKYQLDVAYIEPREKGALQLAFEQLKAKLEAEGLFDPARKRPLPGLPQRIGIVTSLEGAAIRDILSVLKRRFANLEILIHPVRVQGDTAKGEIAQAIDDLNREFPHLDVLLVGRGGGSLEDLWAFNEEVVARAIAASKIPVVSCVGHETDFTIADFVADLRAPTPSAAAELVVRSKEELELHLDQLAARLLASLRSLANAAELRLQHLVLGGLLPSLRQRLTLIEGRLQKALSRPVFTRPRALWEDRERRAVELAGRALAAMPRLVDRKEERLRGLLGKLHALSPLAVLSRGYSIVYALPEGRVVRAAEELKPGDRLRLRFHRGEARAKVTEAETQEELPLG